MVVKELRFQALQLLKDVPEKWKPWSTRVEQAVRHV